MTSLLSLSLPQTGQSQRIPTISIVDRAATLCQTIKRLPSDWQLTPTYRKKPYLPGWRSKQLDRSDLTKMIQYGHWQEGSNGLYRIDPDGLALIVPRGFVVVDVDGGAARHLMKQQQNGVGNPLTISWTSGKTDRASVLYRLPELLRQRLEALPQPLRKVVLADGIKHYRQAIELQLAGQPATLPPSNHPETNRYRWLKVNGQELAPWDIEAAEAPPWVVDAIEAEINRRETIKPVKSGRSNGWRSLDQGSLEDLISNALDQIDPDCHYDDWFKILCALKSTDFDCRDIAEEWSAGGFKYDARSFDRTWDSIEQREDGYTISSLLGMAGIQVTDEISRSQWLTKGFGNPREGELTPVQERERLITKRSLTFRTRYWKSLKDDFSDDKANTWYNGYCPILDLDRSRTFLVSGWLGSGKTESILKSLAKHCRDKLIVWVTTRNGLLHQTIVRGTAIGLDTFHYQDDVVGNKVLLEADSSVLLTAAIDSFKPYSGFAKVDWSKAVLVVDEWRSVRTGILSKLNASEIFPAFERALREAGTLIVADAFLSKVDRSIIRKYRGRDRLVYRQECSKSPKQIKWVEVSTKDGKIALSHDGVYLHLVDQKIAAGRRHVIAVDNLAIAQTLTHYIRNKGKSVKLVCSKTPETNGLFMADPDGTIEHEQPDFVIYTPTAQAGLDIQAPFDSGLMIATGVLSPCDILQMLGRARQCQNWTVAAPRYTDQEALYTKLDGKRVAVWADQLKLVSDQLNIQTSDAAKSWATWQNLTRDIEKTFNSEYLYCLLEYFFESVETVTIAGDRVAEWRTLQAEVKTESTIKVLTGNVLNGQRLLAQQKAPQTNQEVYDIQAAITASQHSKTFAHLREEYDRIASRGNPKELEQVIAVAKILISGKPDKLKAYLTVTDDNTYNKHLKHLQSKRFVSFCSPQWKRYVQMRLFRELNLEQLARMTRRGKLEAGVNAFNKDSAIVSELYQQFRSIRDLAALFPFIENQRQFWLVVCRCMTAFGFENCGKKIRVKTDKPVKNGFDRKGNRRYSCSKVTHFSAWYRVEESGSEVMWRLMPDLIKEVRATIEAEEKAYEIRDARQAEQEREAERFSWKQARRQVA